MKNCEKIKLVIYTIILFILIVLDQFTKQLANTHLKGKEPFVIIKDVFEFNYLDGGNRGAAWGILSGKINFFIVLTVLICIIIFAIIIRLQILINTNFSSYKKLNALQIAFVVLMAGAIGNFIDRITNGYVIDFIYFKLIDFPIFNVADCYVTCSAVILLILCIFVVSDEEFAYIFAIKNKKRTEIDGQV